MVAFISSTKSNSCFTRVVSLEELLDELNVCEDETFLPIEEVESLRRESWRVHKLINGYVRFLRSRASADSSRVRESVADDDLNELLANRFNA